jgi:hypothetical protein
MTQDLITESWHGTQSGYQYHRCRCDQCRAVNADRSKAIRYASIDARRNTERAYYSASAESINTRTADRRRSQQATSAASADNTYQPWSGDEDELIMRLLPGPEGKLVPNYEHSCIACALVLGRTFASVKNRRSVLRKANARRSSGLEKSKSLPGPVMRSEDLASKS